MVIITNPSAPIKKGWVLERETQKGEDARHLQPHIDHRRNQDHTTADADDTGDDPEGNAPEKECQHVIDGNGVGGFAVSIRMELRRITSPKRVVR